MKIVSNKLIIMMIWLVVATQVRAAITNSNWLLATSSSSVTNAQWAFPAGTLSVPILPILLANQTRYSINDQLSWSEAKIGLKESFVANPGNTTALEFSYNGNHADYLNNSTLTLSSTVSGLPANAFLANIQLSYDTRWNNAKPIVETWAYSLNGGAFLNFQTNSMAGNGVWQAITAQLSGIQFQNGDTITLRNTFSGASGNNGKLDFDNIQIISSLYVPVPEPGTTKLAAASIGFAWLMVFLRLKTPPRI